MKQLKNIKFPLDRVNSRRIILSIRRGERFQNWMRQCITAKEYYFLRKSNLIGIDGALFCATLRKVLLESNINLSQEEFEGLVRAYGKLSLLICLKRFGAVKKEIDTKSPYFTHFAWNLFLVSVKSRTSLSVSTKVDSTFTTEKNIHIIAPVCPDYAYKVEPDGSYRYTFDGIGSSVGLVASKAIKNLSELENILTVFPNIRYLIDIQILLGDFEITTLNLEKFNLTAKEFLKRIDGSCSEINKITGHKTERFTNLTNGINEWDGQIQYCKYLHNLNSYDDLGLVLPHINHEQNLISRIPLYRRWHGDNLDYRNIFFEQVIEYILMGKLIFEKYGNTCFLLASDHKAMRCYYNCLYPVNLLGSAAAY